jgi:hypothetical protein
VENTVQNNTMEVARDISFYYLVFSGSTRTC